MQKKMTNEEFVQKNEEMMQEEHRASMEHKRMLNSLEDTYRKERREIEDAYNKAVRNENDKYHEEQEQRMMARRRMKAEYFAEREASCE